MDGTNPEKYETMRNDPKNNLTVIEHIFSGSSSEINGKEVDVKKLLAAYGNGNNHVLDLLLTPISLLEETKTIEEVEEYRDQQAKERMGIGFVMIFDIPLMMELEELNIFVETGPLKDGKIDQWRLFLLNQYTKVSTKDPEDFKKLQVDQYKEFFRLGPVEISKSEHGEEPYVLLSFGRHI